MNMGPSPAECPEHETPIRWLTALVGVCPQDANDQFWLRDHDGAHRERSVIGQGLMRLLDQQQPGVAEALQTDLRALTPDRHIDRAGKSVPLHIAMPRPAGVTVSIFLGGTWRMITIRPLLLALAAAAEYRLQLPRNQEKGGWTGCNPEWMFERADEELDEVCAVLTAGTEGNEPLNPVKVADTEALLLESADVVNMLMMLCDTAGALAAVPGERN